MPVSLAILILALTLTLAHHTPNNPTLTIMLTLTDIWRQVRQRTDALDALGNTTAATGKGFAIGSAVLTALALLSAFEKEVATGGGKLSADIVLDRMVRSCGQYQG